MNCATIHKKFFQQVTRPNCQTPVTLLTGRKHQIRVQLASTGTPIKGDLKYGAKRSNPGGGISLIAKKIEFIHPVSKEKIEVETDPLPEMLPILQN